MNDRVVGAAGWLRGLHAALGQVPSTNLHRAPDDPYDPDDDLPFTWKDDQE